MQKQIEILRMITALMAEGGIAIPIIFGAIAGIGAIFRGAFGDGPSPTELADLIEEQVANNAAYGAAEVARLRALIGEA